MPKTKSTKPVWPAKPLAPYVVTIGCNEEADAVMLFNIARRLRLRVKLSAPATSANSGKTATPPGAIMGSPANVFTEAPNVIVDNSVTLSPDELAYTTEIGSTPATMNKLFGPGVAFTVVFDDAARASIVLGQDNRTYTVYAANEQIASRVAPLVEAGAPLRVVNPNRAAPQSAELTTHAPATAAVVEPATQPANAAIDDRPAFDAASSYGDFVLHLAGLREWCREHKIDFVKALDDSNTIA